MSALNLFIWLGYFLRTLEAGCVKRKPRTRTEIVSSDVPCAFIYVMLLNSLILLFRSFPPRTQWLQEDLSLRQKWMGKSFFLKKKKPYYPWKENVPRKPPLSQTEPAKPSFRPHCRAASIPNSKV